MLGAHGGKWGHVGTPASPCTARGNADGAEALETEWCVLQKASRELPRDSVPCPRVCQEHGEHVSTHVHSGAVQGGRKRAQPRCPTSDERIDETWRSIGSRHSVDILEGGAQGTQPVQTHHTSRGPVGGAVVRVRETCRISPPGAGRTLVAEGARGALQDDGSVTATTLSVLQRLSRGTLRMVTFRVCELCICKVKN